MTGHEAHKDVCRWATEAFEAAAKPGARLFYATQTPAFVEEMVPQLEPFNIFKPGSPPVTPARSSRSIFTCDGELLALKASRSRPTRARSKDCWRSSAKTASVGSSVTRTTARPLARRRRWGRSRSRSRDIIDAFGDRSVTSAPIRSSGTTCVAPRRATSCSATRTRWRRSEYVDALVRAAQPTGQDHYAYTMICPRRRRRSPRACANGSASRSARCRHLPDQRQLRRARDRCSARSSTPATTSIFVSPPWFFYETLIVGRGSDARSRARRPRAFLRPGPRARSRPRSPPRTRAIIVNSPHNPDRSDLHRPSSSTRSRALLSRPRTATASRIYLLSDEAYNRIVFDDRALHHAASRTTRTRSCSTRTRRRCWRRARGSATSRCRRDDARAAELQRRAA